MREKIDAEYETVSGLMRPIKLAPTVQSGVMELDLMSIRYLLVFEVKIHKSKDVLLQTESLENSRATDVGNNCDQ